jgi:hypothetical protein
MVDGFRLKSETKHVSDLRHDFRKHASDLMHTVSFSSILSCYFSNILGVLMTDSILDRIERLETEQAWLRQFVIPEEDRARFTTMPWRGEYRWFRAVNVVCLEKARAVRATSHVEAPAA